MKYEIVHDIIANQVFRKASEATRRRLQAKKYVEGRFDFFEDDRARADALPTAGLLSLEELRKIDVYKDEIVFKAEVLEYIEASRQALATAEELALAKAEAALKQERVNAARELSIAEHRDRAKEQVILRTRIGMIATSILGLLLFLGAFYAQTAYWKAKASEAVAEAVRAFHVEGDITMMYGKAKEALSFSWLMPEAQAQLYQSIFDADRENRLYYTDINSDAEINIVAKGEGDTQPHSVVSPNEQYIAVISDTTTVTIYDLTKPRGKATVFKVALSKDEHIFMLAFSDDNQRLLVGCTNSVRIYGIHKTGNNSAALASKIIGVKDLIYLKSNKDFFFTVSKEGLVQKIAFDTHKRQTFLLPTALAGTSFIDAAMGADNKNLMLISEDGSTERLFALQLQGQILVEQLRFENSPNHSFNDSTLIVQDEASIKLYNLNHLIDKKPYFIHELEDAAGKSITIGNDFFVVNGSDADLIYGINKDSTHLLGDFDKIRLENDSYLEYNAQADLNFLLLSYHKQVFLYNKNRQINSVSAYHLIGHKADIIFKQVLPKSHKILTISDDGNIKTWQIGAPCVVELNMGDYSEPIAHTDFSTNDKYVLTVADSSHQTTLWRTDSLSKPYIVQKTSTLPFACFSPDNRYLIMPSIKALSYFRINDFWDNKTPIAQNIAVGADIKWCKRSENGENILAATSAGCLISMNANNPTAQIDTLAMVTAVRKVKPKGVKTKKAIAYLDSPIDSASTSADGRYIVVYSAKKTELIDSKGIKSRNYAMLTRDSLLSLTFSPKMDALLLASINTNAKENPLKAVKITRFNTIFLIDDKILPIIKGYFEPESLHFGRTNEIILYKVGTNQQCYNSNTGKTDTLETDFLAYHEGSDKWMISHSNIVSPNADKDFFGTYNSMSSALRAYSKIKSRFKQRTKERISRWSVAIPSQKGDYWAIHPNQYEEADGGNIFTIYNKDCQPIATFSAQQNMQLKAYEHEMLYEERKATFQFSPKGHFLLTKSTEGGVKIWFWNITTIKKVMDDFLQVASV